eukprot:TRINITY_DN5078_c0_g1_i1.p1 TRINITY_DN5078_c0_g1~~TRINITY_DN5078_c0_g1_i1.p1  ORF type:complete len:199 (-),score=55.89 TRINITY_DN5078_c0_g1_i1:106-702(-)
MSSSLSRVARLDPQKSIFLLCDMQTKFRSNISHFPAILSNTAKLMKASSILNIPMEATEQYPKGLGHTVPELELSSYGIQPTPKTQFSMLIPELLPTIQSKESVILAGIEAHACILHTVLDLVELSKSVYIPVDCVSSRSPIDRKLAFRRMASLPGVHLTSVETLILELLKDSSHTNFRACQALINPLSEDSDLMNLI